MHPFTFDQNRLNNDFADLLKDFLIDGYSNGRFELPQVQSLAKTFVTNTALINTPDQATDDPALKQAFLLILKHAKLLQIKLYVTNLITHISNPSQLPEVQTQLQTLLDTVNSPIYSDKQL